MNRKFWSRFFESSLSSNLKSKIQNRKWAGRLAILFVLVGCVEMAEAQQPKVYRVGVLLPGVAWYEIIDGLRVGLKELGLEEGKQFVLEIRDTKGDLKAAEEAARNLEQEKVNLIYTTRTSVTIAAKRATADIPIVFCAGTDPVVLGLVESFAKPGGRLTGVYEPGTDLTGKRLEILKEMLPKLSRVVTVYNPNNRVAVEAAALARQAAKQFGVQLIERHATSVEELRQRVEALKAKEADAYFYTSDSMVTSQAQLVVDTATSKKLPTMFSEQSLVAMGGLASYGQNFHEVGRLSAKNVQKVMTGGQPRDMRVETVDKFELVINLKAAKQIGLTIPPNVRASADRVIK